MTTDSAIILMAAILAFVYMGGVFATVAYDVEHEDPRLYSPDMDMQMPFAAVFFPLTWLWRLTLGRKRTGLIAR